MTVLVFKDGVLASDSILFADDTQYCEAPKVKKIKKRLVGVFGEYFNCVKYFKMLEELDEDAFYDDYLDENPIDKASGAYIVSKVGKNYYVDVFEGTSHFTIENPEYLADGSGMQYALGALHMGATVDEAVETAIKFSRTCGGKIQKVSF